MLWDAIHFYSGAGACCYTFLLWCRGLLLYPFGSGAGACCYTFLLWCRGLLLYIFDVVGRVRGPCCGTCPGPMLWDVFGAHVVGRVRGPCCERVRGQFSLKTGTPFFQQKRAHHVSSKNGHASFATNYEGRHYLLYHACFLSGRVGSCRVGWLADRSIDSLIDRAIDHSSNASRIGFSV